MLGAESLRKQPGFFSCLYTLGLSVYSWLSWISAHTPDMLEHVDRVPASSQTRGCLPPPSPCTVLWSRSQPDCSSHTELLTVQGFHTFTYRDILLNCPREFLRLCSGHHLRPLVDCPPCGMQAPGSGCQLPSKCPSSVLFHRIPW